MADHASQATYCASAMMKRRMNVFLDILLDKPNVLAEATPDRETTW